MYEREIRNTLSKLELLCSRIPEKDSQQRSLDDLQRFQDQFKDLLFSEVSDEIKLEKDFKKLVTVTKSKFYMLKINYPKAFDEVNYELADSTKLELPEVEHDPFA